MNRRIEAMGRTDRHVKKIAAIIVRLIDEMVLAVHDTTHEPRMQVEEYGCIATWSPLSCGDSGDWEHSVIEIFDRVPASSVRAREMVLAAEVIPGVFGSSVEVRWRDSWKVRFSCSFDMAAVHDDRSVNHLALFCEPET